MLDNSPSNAEQESAARRVSGRGPTSYWNEPWVRALMGCAVAVVVLLVGYGGSGGLDGGLDGPCIGDSEFARSIPEGGDITKSEYSLWPPGLRCEARLPTGEMRAKTFPPPGTWAIAGVAVLATVVVPVPFLRRRRRRQRYRA